MKMFGIFLLLLLLTSVGSRAATFTVTTPGQQTLTNKFLPYAGSGTQLLGNSPAWRDSAGVLGINNYLEGLETLTPAAVVNLDFSTWRTKRITLNQNTVFTAINIPSASTNVQTMLLEVIGDGALTVSFANVTFQTPTITTPDAGVVTLYALRGDSGAVKGYTQAVAASGVTTINPTDGYLPYRSNATTFADSPLVQIVPSRLALMNGVPQLSLSTNGAVIIGAGTSNYWGDSFINASGASVVSVRDTTVGDPDYNSFYFDVSRTNDWSQIYGEMTHQVNDFVMISHAASGLQATFEAQASDGNYAQLEMNIGGTNYWHMYPATGSGTVGYLFDSLYVRTNHANPFFKIANHGTTAFAVQPVSGYSGAGTLFLSDDGTYKAVGGTVTESFGIACSDETTPLTTGTAKVTFRMPYAFTVTAVRASLTTAQASGNIFTVDINEAGVSILSTKLTIDNTETTSTTAVTAPVISDSALADDASITIDIDQIGNGSATGLKVWIIGHQ